MDVRRPHLEKQHHALSSCLARTQLNMADGNRAERRFGWRGREPVFVLRRRVYVCRTVVPHIVNQALSYYFC